MRVCVLMVSIGRIVRRDVHPMYRPIRASVEIIRQPRDQLTQCAVTYNHSKSHHPKSHHGLTDNQL